MAKTILILGASVAGLTVAHRLLKATLPGLAEEYKVVLVSPMDHAYWNVATVRAIIPGQIKTEQLFASVPDSFAEYGDKVEFVLGTATKLEPASKTVTISIAAKGDRKQTYDILVIATGAHSVGNVPWKASPSGYQATIDALHRIQEQVKAAKTIVVGGAGATGVESSGELGYEYGKDKEITLITAADSVLETLPPHVSAFAENELTKLNVKVVKGIKITSSKPSSDGKTELTLSSGEKKIVDLYLPTTGLVPNSEFIPKTLLNEGGFVKVDEFLHVKGFSDIWAAGDVADVQAPQIVHASKQAIALSKSLDLVLKQGEPVAYVPDATPAIGITLGRGRGTGRYGNWKVPSLLIWFVKGRGLFLDKLPVMAAGNMSF